MISNPLTKTSKGIMFLGCSFTWGQGLYYYSNLSTIVEPPNAGEYIHDLVKESHKKFMESIRYPRLVANHFNTWELVHPFNGGNNKGSIKWFRGWFTNTDFEEPGMPKKLYDFDEIGYAFIQLTQFQRNSFTFEYMDQKHEVCLTDLLDKNSNYRELYQLFLDYLNYNNIDLENWIEKYIQDNINEVKDFLMLCESHGIKTGLLTYPNDYIPFIAKDSWLSERFIELEYKNSTFKSIDDLMEKHGECQIIRDYESFVEPPKDFHPSKVAHRVIADAIIEYINKTGAT